MAKQTVYLNNFARKSGFRLQFLTSLITCRVSNPEDTVTWYGYKTRSKRNCVFLLSRHLQALVI